MYQSAVNAKGQSIPPFFAHASHGAIGIANGNGWMTAEEFLKYLEHFIKHCGANAAAPTLLLLKNHTSHRGH